MKLTSNLKLRPDFLYLAPLLNVVMLLMPLATLAALLELLDDLFCCRAAANWRIEL